MLPLNMLIGYLKQLESDESLQNSGKILSYDNDTVYNAACIATSVLIDEGGSCEWENITILKDNGFYVFPLEKDRFGWLIGGISTNKGIISYG